MQKGCAFEMISSEVQAEPRSWSKIHLATWSNSSSQRVEIGAILYIMAKFVEMDEKIKFKDKTEEKIDGPIEF